MKKLTGWLPYQIDTPAFQPVQMKVLEEFMYKNENFYVVNRYVWNNEMEEYFPIDNEFMIFDSRGIRMADIFYTDSPKKAIQSAVKFMEGIANQAFMVGIENSKSNQIKEFWEYYRKQINQVEL